MKNKGFSLVELIVVIAIMAILVGVAVPVYTSYIGKANAAKDEQLLGEINSAFMVAAVAEGVTDFTFAGEPENNKPAITVADDGTIDIENMKPDYLADAMVEILGTDLKFSVIEKIFYNERSRQFENGTTEEYEYGGGKVYLNPADISAFGSSNFAGVGIDTLMNLVDNATDTVGELGVDSDLYKLLFDDTEEITGLSATSKNTLAKLLLHEELSASNEEAFGAALNQLLIDAGCEEGLNDENAKTTLKGIAANAAVLSAATQTENSQELLNSLSKGDALDELKDVNNPNQIGDIAMAYAMYTAYQSKNGQDVSTEISEVLNGLSDPQFQAYAATKEASDDMKGYLAAMNMIDASSEDTKAVSSLLVNGFADDELVTLLQGALSK